MYKRHKIGDHWLINVATIDDIKKSVASKQTVKKSPKTTNSLTPSPTTGASYGSIGSSLPDRPFRPNPSIPPSDRSISTCSAKKRKIAPGVNSLPGACKVSYPSPASRAFLRVFMIYWRCYTMTMNKLILLPPTFVRPCRKVNQVRFLAVIVRAIYSTPSQQQLILQ